MASSCLRLHAGGVLTFIRAPQNFQWQVIEGQGGVEQCAAAVGCLEKEMRPVTTTVNKALAESKIGEANMRPCPLPSSWQPRTASASAMPRPERSVTCIHDSPHLDIDEVALPIIAALNPRSRRDRVREQTASTRQAAADHLQVHGVPLFLPLTQRPTTIGLFVWLFIQNR